MIEAQPSRTALRVALRRAAHQVVDAEPLIFADPCAIPILPREHQRELARTPDAARRPFSAALRAFMVARARFAEDTLAHAVEAHPDGLQYLVLGAGLDTYTCRHPHAGVRVFEVDHPATQAWKLECLREAELASVATFVAVDFERDALRERLEASGFSFAQPTVVAWLGVAPYLELAAFRATLRVLGCLPTGSELVMDYAYPREVLPPVEQQMLDSLSERVAGAGEPFRLFLTEDGLRAEFSAAGLRLVRNLGTSELNAMYCSDRTDGLALRGGAGHIAHASVGVESAV